MKELISARVAPEMKSDLSKLARIYRVYEPDIYRMAFSQFILNNLDRLKTFESKAGTDHKNKKEKSELIDEVLESGVHYERFHYFEFIMEEADYQVIARPTELEAEGSYEYLVEIAFSPKNTLMTKRLFAVEFKEESVRIEQEKAYGEGFNKYNSVGQILFTFATELIIELVSSKEHSKWVREFSSIIAELDTKF